MNENKIKKIFAAVRHEPAPEVPFNFAQSVIAEIRRAKPPATRSNLLDQIGGLFPRLAGAALLVIGLCLFGDFYFSERDAALSDNLAQLTEDWLFAAK